MVHPLNEDEFRRIADSELPGNPPDGCTVEQLTGDASTRRYYRIRTPSGRTLVLMQMAEPFDPDNFPYLHNYRLFREAGVPLAEVYSLNPANGTVLLQDLGDSTYYELHAGWNEQTRFRFFLNALEHLPRISCIRPADPLAFDTEKLQWELEFFLEYFVGGLRGIHLSEQERGDLIAQFHRLASELAGQPRVFCHRDYHSRNLMVHQDRPYVVDFQDARLGPATYDLASLCYDSYIQHAPAFIAHLERVFFTYFPDARLQRFEYPRMCLQRNLKALGTFGYQAGRLGRNFYLQFVDPTLGYVKRHFEKLPDYAEMRKILARYLPV